MKTIPMIFNQEMVKALVAGNKAVTRRPLKVQPPKWCERFGYTTFTPTRHISCRGTYENEGPAEKFFKQPVFKGDLIWVRETFRLFDSSTECGCSESPCNCPSSGTPIYRAWGCDTGEETWKPSIHMPRWASRLTLRVTDVRVECVQDITKEQAKKEGLSPTGCTKGYWHTEYMRLWNSIYANWDDNPWVWVIEFEVIHKNVDQVLAEVAA